MEPDLTTFSPKSPRRLFSRRGILLGGLSVALAACTQTILEPEVAQSVTIRRVSVVMTNTAQYSVRELTISRDRFASDLKTQVERKLGNRFTRNGNAELIIAPKRVWLKTPGESLFIGGPSFIDAEVTVRRISDGATISGPSQFSGMAQQPRMGGIFGAMGAPSAQDDYRLTLEGFADMINAALFEGGATTY